MRDGALPSGPPEGVLEAAARRLERAAAALERRAAASRPPPDDDALRLQAELRLELGAARARGRALEEVAADAGAALGRAAAEVRAALAAES